MSDLSIKLFPDAVLRQECTRIRHFDEQLRSFIEHLKMTMYGQPGGIGIAAPQVGRAIQVALVDVSSKVSGAPLRVLINPKIRTQANAITFREGCMSLPHFTANVTRWSEVTVEFRSVEGQLQRCSAKGIEAICIQHEVDHLNGLLFVDRVTSLKSDVFRRKRYS
jgi:peptide deformylase